MRFVVLALVLLPAPALAEERDPPAPIAAAPKCHNAEAQLAGKQPQSLRPRTLADQPLAGQYKTVLRFENGCDVPVKIRDDVGTEQR